MVEGQEDYVLPKGNDRIKMDKALLEVENSMRRQAGEKSYITETLKVISKEYGIPAKALRKVCTQHVNDSFEKNVAKSEAEQELYEALHGTENSSQANNEFESN